MRSPVLATLASIPIALASADVIKLKSGESIEGKITNTTASTVSIAVNATPSIVEQRVVMREDILAMDREAPDETAYQELARLKTPDTARSATPYDHLIEKVLKPFIRQFPNSERVNDVNAMIRRLDEERTRILLGEVKVAGRFFNATDYAKQKYQLDAEILFEEMKLAAARRDLIAIANGFDELSKTYQDSIAYIESIDLAKDSLRKLDQRIAFELQIFPAKAAERDKTIEQAELRDRARVQEAIAAEDAQMKAIAQAARQRGLRFFRINGLDTQSLQEMQIAIKELWNRVESPATTKRKEGLRHIRNAESYLSESELAAAEASIFAAQAAWPSYEGLQRLKDQLNSAGLATK